MYVCIVCVYVCVCMCVCVCSYLWDPFSKRRVALLRGHSAPVQDVIINESNQLLVSLSVDKVNYNVYIYICVHII